MSTFNSLPSEESPQLTDRVFTARGTLGSMVEGAERSPTIQTVLDLLTNSANIWSSVARFNGGIGINAVPSSAGMDATTPLYLRREDASGSGVRLGSYHSYEAAFPNTIIGAAALFDVINTGTAAGGGGHLIGLIGRAQDTATSAIPMFGLEGKVVVKGTSDANAGVWSIADYDGATHTGRRRVAFTGFCEIFNGTLSTPVNEGEIIIYHAVNGTGGDPTQRFALLGESLMKIRTGGATHITMEHDGADGKISVSTGAIRLYAPGNFVVLQDGFGLVPLISGTALGIDGFRWRGILSGDTNISLLSSITPGLNGELVFQATSNTSLTFKYKGTDGTVRSASLVLA